MNGKQTPDRKKVHLYKPPSKDFDPFAATEKDLMKHGLPLRPDPQTQPGMAALWERQAARYHNCNQEGSHRSRSGSGPHRIVRLSALQLLGTVHCTVRDMDRARSALH